MKRLLIALVLICCVITAIGVAVAIWAHSELAKSLPEIDGMIELRGLSESVDIYRDGYGIPHIYARNRNDLIFAVGFVSAQDRLWQMDVTRRAATGRLSEIFGESKIEADLLIRTLGLERIAEQQLEKHSPEDLAALEAFSDGVNNGVGQLDALPLEFRVLDYTPDPWQPSDSLAISRLLAWQLSKNYRSELVLAKLAARLGAERAAELGPVYSSDGPFIIPPPEPEPLIDIFDELEGQTVPGEGMSLLDEIVGTSGGSNSWVIGASRSKNNAPILANDPHLSGTRMPSIWYYVHLVGAGYDTIGGLVPGLPLPVLGHNRRIGWGMTNMTADVQDIFLERINPDDPNQYEYNGRWVDMETRVERIHFRTKKGDQSFIEKEVRHTAHGPLMNEVAPGVTQPISLQWTGFEPTTDSMAMAGVNLAKNWGEFCEALRNFAVAPQNFIYADVDGNIGYYGAGIVPVRSGGDGTVPQKGWFRKTEWKGRIPFADMPHIINPPDDYIVTANNRVVGDEYEHFLSAYWAPRFRSQRIAQLIEETEKHDTESVARAQMDSKSLFAELLLDAVMTDLDRISDPVLRDALVYLKEWDFSNTTDSVAATIYHEFLLRFARNTFSDKMGKELAKEYLADYYLWIERFVEFVHEDSYWFDNVRTKDVETRADIAAKSFSQAVAALRERLGDDMSQWKWGSVHRVEFGHPMDSNRIIRMLFNLGPFPFPGDGESVNRGTFDFNKPYDVTMAASLRHIMDLSLLSSTLAVHTTGQSANPVSPHYDDLASKWLDGEYVTMMMNKKDYIVTVEGHLKLMPAH